MRGSKVWLALALLLVGCATEVEAPSDGEGADSLEQTHERLQVEVSPAQGAAQEAPATGSPIDPDAVAATGPGGKPQPDPWRASNPGSPNKPQPDPWAPIQKTQTQAPR